MNKDAMTISEVRDFIKLAESKVGSIETEQNKRQESYVRGLKIMFNMMKDVIKD